MAELLALSRHYVPLGADPDGEWDMVAEGPVGEKWTVGGAGEGPAPPTGGVVGRGSGPTR
ncbi:hypothetical protein OG203_28375 [Nocardia sp. NBC_01499]|uniref:hypothetical protein n=1 Tax=Nocardia sp. NBC_01499 TaxID=2903597 RepID=UPI00386E0FF2